MTLQFACSQEYAPSQRRTRFWSQELLAQAAWNLCPQQTAYSSDCYFQEDQTFDAISGAAHITLTDVPDGVWSLRLKRDKVAGAVRSSDGVKRAAVWAKVGKGAASAACSSVPHVLARQLSARAAWVERRIMFF